MTRWWNGVRAGLAAAILLAGAAGCDGGETSTGTGGAGGTTSGGGQGGGMDCSVPNNPPPASGDWCDRLPPGPAGTGPTPVDWSAAHAMVRFFGPLSDYSIADQALAGAFSSDDAWTGKDLSAYAAARLFYPYFETVGDIIEVRHADPDKTVFHGVGILPDIDVPLSAVDFAAGTDPELEAAVAWLLMQ